MARRKDNGEAPQKPARKRPPFAWKRATGVLHTEDALIITRAQINTVGKRLLTTETVELSTYASEEDPLVAALKHLREEGRLPHPIICGIDPRGLYAVTRQVTEEDKDVTAAELVSAQLGTMEGGLAAAMVPTKLPNGAFRTLVAVSRVRARRMLAGLNGVKAHRMQLPPMPQVILRQATQAGKRPRKWNVCLRLIPGPVFGVAMLTVGDAAVAWRMFAAGKRGKLSRASVEPALLGLMDHARKDLLVDEIHGCLLHVGKNSDLFQGLASELSANLDLPMKLAGSFELDNEAISASLADWGLQSPPHELDLFRGLQPRLGLAENFPRKAAALLVTAIVGCGLTLWNEASEIEAQAATITAKAKKDAAKAKIKLSKIKKEHEVLKLEFGVAKNFIGKRVFWEDFMRVLPDVLPVPMRVVRIEGYDAVSISDKVSATAKKSKLTLTTEMIVPPGVEGTPAEVSIFTQALRQSPEFSGSFPRITGASVRLIKLRDGSSLAKMTVVCMPGKG